jgi:hypothetical protein
MADHVILCPEDGQVEVFTQSLLALERWLYDANTDPIVEYVQRRGQETMEEIVQEAPRRFKAMGQSQDRIGWRRFLEGMISKKSQGSSNNTTC